jgi:glutamate-1-semialdehyde 2,1-aminomutase
MQHLAPVGPVYQAGTLSGNPLAMAAGIAALQLLRELDPYARLHAMGQRLQQAMLAAAAEKGLPLQVPQTGSMFAFFFAEQPVTNFTEVMASGAHHFKALFRQALDRGIYLPPSPYETCFISTAHGDGDLDRAIEGLTAALKAI